MLAIMAYRVKKVPRAGIRLLEIPIPVPQSRRGKLYTVSGRVNKVSYLLHPTISMLHLANISHRIGNEKLW